MTLTSFEKLPDPLEPAPQVAGPGAPHTAHLLQAFSVSLAVSEIQATGSSPSRKFPTDLALPLTAPWCLPQPFQWRPPGIPLRDNEQAGFMLFMGDLGAGTWQRSHSRETDLGDSKHGG